MGEPKAIETLYDGFRFRSRLEARWAVFFNAAGIKYQYEPEGFVLQDGTWYLPDFFIEPRDCENGVGWFVEVKGNYDDPSGLRKAQLLDDVPPEYARGVLVFTEPLLRQAPGVVYYGSERAPDWNHASLVACMLGLSHSEYDTARLAALRARFEHGETPQNRKAMEENNEPETDF